MDETDDILPPSADESPTGSVDHPISANEDVLGEVERSDPVATELETQLVLPTAAAAAAVTPSEHDDLADWGFLDLPIDTELNIDGGGGGVPDESWFDWMDMFLCDDPDRGHGSSSTSRDVTALDSASAVFDRSGSSPSGG